MSGALGLWSQASGLAIARAVVDSLRVGRRMSPVRRRIGRRVEALRRAMLEAAKQLQFIAEKLSIGVFLFQVHRVTFGAKASGKAPRRACDRLALYVSAGSCRWGKS